MNRYTNMYSVHMSLVATVEGEKAPNSTTFTDPEIETRLYEMGFKQSSLFCDIHKRIDGDVLVQVDTERDHKGKGGDSVTYRKLCLRTGKLLESGNVTPQNWWRVLR